MAIKKSSGTALVKKSLASALTGWQKRRKRGEFLRYCRQKPPEDSVSALGKCLDLLAFLLAVWPLCFFILLWLKVGILASAALSALAAAILLVLARRAQRLAGEKRERRRQLWHTSQGFVQKLLEMDPQKEFPGAVRMLLSELPGYEERAETKTKAPKGEEKNAGGPVDLLFARHGEPVVVRCLHAGGGEVGPGEVEDFLRALGRAGVSSGVLATAGTFSPGALWALKAAAGRGFKLAAADCWRLFELAGRAGDDCAVKTGALDTAGQEPGGFCNFKGVSRIMEGGRRQARTHLACGLFLLAAGGYFWGSSLTAAAYLTAAFVNFFLAACQLARARAAENSILDDW